MCRPSGNMEVSGLCPCTNRSDSSCEAEIPSGGAWAHHGVTAGLQGGLLLSCYRGEKEPGGRGSAVMEPGRPVLETGTHLAECLAAGSQSSLQFSSELPRIQLQLSTDLLWSPG